MSTWLVIIFTIMMMMIINMLSAAVGDGDEKEDVVVGVNIDLFCFKFLDFFKTDIGWLAACPHKQFININIIVSLLWIFLHYTEKYTYVHVYVHPQEYQHVSGIVWIFNLVPLFLWRVWHLFLLTFWFLHKKKIRSNVTQLNGWLFGGCVCVCIFWQYCFFF